MGGFFTHLLDFAVELIKQFGYIGVFFGMVVDALGAPIPSQAVMSFAGYMVYKGEFNIWLATLSGALGNLTGACIVYSVARKFGRKFISRFGKYVQYTDEDLQKTDKWFKKWGDELVFLAQLIPGMRTIITVSAGIWKVKLKKFIPYLFTGCFIYCFIMAFLGYKLGDKWEVITGYFDTFENAIMVILFIFLLYIFYKFIKGYLASKQSKKAL